MEQIKDCRVTAVCILELGNAFIEDSCLEVWSVHLSIEDILGCRAGYVLLYEKRACVKTLWVS